MRLYPDPETYLPPPTWAREGSPAWDWRHRTLQAAGNARTGPVASKDAIAVDTRDHPSIRVHAAALAVDRSVHGGPVTTTAYDEVNRRTHSTSAGRRTREIRLSQDIAPKVHTDVYQLLAYYHPAEFEKATAAGDIPNRRMLRVMAVPLLGSGTPIELDSPYSLPNLGQPAWLNQRWHKVIGYHRQYGVLVRAEHARLLMRVYGLGEVESLTAVAATPLAKIEQALYLTDAHRVSNARDWARAQIVLEVTERYGAGSAAVSS